MLAPHRPSRRQFVHGLAGATSTLLAGCEHLPLAAPRPARVARIGLLSASSAAFAAFRAGLRDLGYVEGTNVVIESRGGAAAGLTESDNEQLPGLAAELVERHVDVLVTHGLGVHAAQRATATLPIVMAAYPDAVAAGVIASLAHPGGNVTGVTFFNPELMAKRLELLHEVLPALRQAAVLLYPNNPVNGAILAALATAAQGLQVAVQPFEVRALSEFEPTFAAMADRHVEALVLHDDPFFIRYASGLAGLAAQQRLASIGFLEAAAAGGLLAYGVEFRELFRRAAYFVDRILKGAKPADLPVERPTTFQFVINLPTAQTLGLTIPRSVLEQATEVIQ